MKPLIFAACMTLAHMTAHSATDNWPIEAGQHARITELHVDGQTVTTRLQLYLPAGIVTESGKKWPLIVFLHGSGERGDNVDQVTVNGPPKILRERTDFPFIVASPQADANARWEPKCLDALLDDLLQRLPVDADRVYLTGLSLGGNGTWKWAAASPDRFAAIAPVCGWSDVATACRIKTVPVWAFHGEADSVVKFSDGKVMADAVAACGGDVRFTGYPGVDHDSWTPTYDNPALYDWFAQHRRAAK